MATQFVADMVEKDAGRKGMAAHIHILKFKYSVESKTYKYFAFFCTILAVLVLVSCAKGPVGGINGAWQRPVNVAGHDPMEALFRRSAEIKAIKGRVVARVVVNGEERPSVKSDVHWFKDPDGNVNFSIVGYGPFLMTAFEASLKDSGFQLKLPGKRAVYRLRPSVLERWFARLIFDPWGIAAVRGARCERGKNGEVIVVGDIMGNEVKGEFDSSLNPIFIASRKIKIIFDLPRKIMVTLTRNEARIDIELRFV